MAVDTRNKRFSILGIAQPFPCVFADPDGTISAPDRAQIIFLYSGIALSAPVVVSPDCFIALLGDINSEKAFVVGGIDSKESYGVGVIISTLQRTSGIDASVLILGGVLSSSALLLSSGIQGALGIEGHLCCD